MTTVRIEKWVDGISRGLILRATSRAPSALAARLEEEWLADFAEQRGLIERLRFAIGCCWATLIITHEYAIAATTAAGASVGQASLAGFMPDDSNFFSSRTTTFFLVVCLHVAVLYGLMIGLGAKISKVIPASFENRVLESLPRDGLPPLPRPQIPASPLEIPIQEAMPPPVAADTAEIAEPVPLEPEGPAIPPAGPLAIKRVQGGPGAGFPGTDQVYPDMAILLGETGVATVRACVDPKGRLTNDPIVFESTGIARLDAAALKLAKAGSGHYRATTENGLPVDSCYSFRIRFELHR